MFLRFLPRKVYPRVSGGAPTNTPNDGFIFVEGGFENIQLDIVGFLAILGEGSVLANAEVSSLSKWIFVPRLLPAPQALLRPSRPHRLHPNLGYVTAVHSGNHVNHINHIGNIVIDAESMPDFAVRCVEIIRDPSKPNVKAKTRGPLTLLSALGCILCIILLALAIRYQDLPALLADISLAALSTLIGIGNKWTLNLPKRTANTQVPDGDVVIRYPKGSFLIVKCQENVARELYFAPENIDYLVSHPPIYRLISLAGTILLMFGVISLANAENILQMAFAVAYMILNAAYWIVAAVPAKMHWDTSAFTVKNHRFDKTYNPIDNRLEPVVRIKNEVMLNKTFTQALWKVIVITKSADWVRLGKAAPETPIWDQWLKDAVAESKKDPKPMYQDDDEMTVWKMPKWDPQKHLTSLMEKGKVAQTQAMVPPKPVTPDDESTEQQEHV